MKYTNDASIARFIVRSSDKANDLFGRDIVEQAEVINFLCYGKSCQMIDAFALHILNLIFGE